MLGAVFLDVRLTAKTAFGGLLILVSLGLVLDPTGGGTRSWRGQRGKQ